MKMKNTCLLLLCVLFCVSSYDVYAQRKMNFNISLGGSVPLGDFGHINYNPSNLSTDWGLFDEGTKGGATVGFNIGTSIYFKLNNEKIDVFISVDFHRNGLKGDAKACLTDYTNYIADMLGQQLIDSGSTLISSTGILEKTPSYINVPIMVGLRYIQPLSIGMKVFAEGGIGLNLRYVTSWQETCRFKAIYPGASYTSYGHITETISYENAYTFSFRLGGGICLTDAISISAHYFYLGKGDVSAKVSAEGSVDNSSPLTSTDYIKFKTITPNLFTVKMGVTF